MNGELGMAWEEYYRVKNVMTYDNKYRATGAQGAGPSLWGAATRGEVLVLRRRPFGPVGCSDRGEVGHTVAQPYQN